MPSRNLLLLIVIGSIAGVPIVSIGRAASAPGGPPAELKRVLDLANPKRIDADIRFLADDSLEGRGTGQKGGRLAALYIDTRFRLLGLEPGASKDSYLQEVPLVGIATESQSQMAIVAGDQRLEARWLGDF